MEFTIRDNRSLRQLTPWSSELFGQNIVSCDARYTGTVGVYSAPHCDERDLEDIGG